MIIIMHCSVSNILIKTIINTYIVAYMHSWVKLYECTLIIQTNNSVNCITWSETDIIDHAWENRADVHIKFGIRVHQNLKH